LIIESIRIAAIPAKRGELVRALGAWAGPTAVESGCLSCRIFQETTDPQALYYQAQWKTQDDLLRHIRTEHYKRLLALMELGTAPPLVEFHTVTETRGLDLIERTRKVQEVHISSAQE
jgi:quinol monooxygenase YgiN